jgi:hypothetical protein
VRTEDLIVQLASGAGAVQPLPRPSVRLARWTAGVIPLIALAVMVIGPRRDVLTAIRQPTFMVLALLTLATALLAAASAFVLSVPGAERAPSYRTTALTAGSVWAFMLVVWLMEGGDAARRLLVLPIHWLCVIEIAGLGVIPGWALFGMLRRAAPLRRAWTGALATLAAAALGAAATQVLCPIDDPAHQLVGHLLPVTVLAVAGTIAGRRAFDWLHRPPLTRRDASG